MRIRMKEGEMVKTNYAINHRIKSKEKMSKKLNWMTNSILVRLKEFRSTKEAEDEWTCVDRSAKWRLVRRRGSRHKREPKPDPLKPRGGKAKKGRTCDKVEKDTTDRAKAKTRTWADVVKGRKKDELETTDLVKSQCELDAVDSIEMFNLEELNRLGKQTRRQPKPTLTWRSRRVEVR